MPRHLLAVALLVILTAVVYGKVTAAYFYGYDDFLEAHRAAFEDTADPSRIFTTSHFDSPKFRPLARTLDYLAFHLGDGDPLPWRIRGVGFHIVSVFSVYVLGVLLFGSLEVAVGSGLILALHPLVNQNVVASSWTVTTAGGLLLCSLALFIRSTQKESLGRLALALCLLAATLFVYESGIVLIGYFYLYLILLWRQGRPVPSKFVSILTAAVAVICLAFFSARAMVLVHKPEIATVPEILKNTAFYGGALLSSPIDSLLAHDVLGTPLPSEIRMDTSAVLFAATALISLLSLGLLALREWRQPVPKATPWAEILFLIVAAAGSVTPFLFFNGHASETYLYLPVAFLSLGVTGILFHCVRSRGIRYGVFAILLMLFAAATINRNRRVTEGAAIAARIAENLPVDRWRSGNWTVYLAEADPVLPRYGIYQYQGLATIDVGHPGMPAAECLLQMATYNPGVKARVVQPAAMPAPCPQAGSCFWVHADGSITPAGVDR